MLNTKIVKPTTQQQTTEERLFKLLESMDWKLWEMMNMMKKASEPEKPSDKKATLESKEQPKPKLKPPTVKSSAKKDAA